MGIGNVKLWRVIVSRGVPAMLRARFGIPHHDERTGAYLHDRGDNSVVQFSGRELSEIEITPLGGGPTQVHDEVAHTLGAASNPYSSGLGSASHV